jgi:SAM-dependent methyltransferase
VSNAVHDIVAINRRHAGASTTARGAKFHERAWPDRLLALLPVTGLVLDLGCGSGIPIARELSDQGPAVTGLDSTPEMVALFQVNLQTQKKYWRP